MQITAIQATSVEARKHESKVCTLTESTRQAIGYESDNSERSDRSRSCTSSSWADCEEDEMDFSVMPQLGRIEDAEDADRSRNNSLELKQAVVHQEKEPAKKKSPKPVKANNTPKEVPTTTQKVRHKAKKVFTNGQPRNGHPAHTIFVKGFSYQVTADDLEEFFSPCGTVTKVALPKDSRGRSRRIAWITFVDEISFTAALDFHGEKLTRTLSGKTVDCTLRVTEAAPGPRRPYPVVIREQPTDPMLEAFLTCFESRFPQKSTWKGCVSTTKTRRELVKLLWKKGWVEVTKKIIPPLQKVFKECKIRKMMGTKMRNFLERDNLFEVQLVQKQMRVRLNPEAEQDPERIIIAPTADDQECIDESSGSEVSDLSTSSYSRSSSFTDSPSESVSATSVQSRVCTAPHEPRMMKWALSPLDDTDAVQEHPQAEMSTPKTRPNDVIKIGGMLPFPEITCVTEKSAVLRFKALPDSCITVAVCLRNCTTGQAMFFDRATNEFMRNWSEATPARRDQSPELLDLAPATSYDVQLSIGTGSSWGEWTPATRFATAVSSHVTLTTVAAVRMLVPLELVSPLNGILSTQASTAQCTFATGFANGVSQYTLLVNGSHRSITAVLRMVAKVFAKASTGDYHTNVTFLIPESQAGRFIGKRGHNVKKLQERCRDLRVVVNKDSIYIGESMFQTCVVSGPLNGASHAMSNLSKLLMECDVCAQARNPTHSTSPITTQARSYQYMMTDQGQMYTMQGYYPTSYSPVNNGMTQQQPQAVNVPQYMSWGPGDVLNWMLSLENGRLRKYQDILKQSMERSPVSGYDLPHVNMLTARQMGIFDVADQDFLLKQVSAITHPSTPSMGSYAQMYSFPSAAYSPQGY